MLAAGAVGRNVLAQAQTVQQSQTSYAEPAGVGADSRPRASRGGAVGATGVEGVGGLALAGALQQITAWMQQTTYRLDALEGLVRTIDGRTEKMMEMLSDLQKTKL